MSSKIRILIAEEHYLVRQGIVNLLELDEDITVVGNAADGKDLIDKYFSLNPDIVITDIIIPNKNGFEVLQTIKSIDPNVKLLFLTTLNDSSCKHTSYCMGAAGYICRSYELHAAIKDIHFGKSHYDEAFNSSFTKFIKTSGSDFELSFLQNDVSFTFREEQVVLLIGKGYQSSEIASKIGTSKRTVDMYRSQIITKLDLRQKAHLIIYSVYYSLKNTNRNLFI